MKSSLSSKPIQRRKRRSAAAVDELIDINPNVSLMLNRCQIGAGGAHYGSYEYYGRSEAAETPAGKDKPSSEG